MYDIHMQILIKMLNSIMKPERLDTIYIRYKLVQLSTGFCLLCKIHFLIDCMRYYTFWTSNEFANEDLMQTCTAYNVSVN